MKKLLIAVSVAAISLLNLSGPVFAAENFNGPYIGVQIGYADGKHYGEEFEDDRTLTGFTSKNTTNKISNHPLHLG
jgi:hypothetical protein